MKPTRNTPAVKPPICYSQVTTYAELRAHLPATEKKPVPGITQLRNTARSILHAQGKFGILEVYDNGFYTYSNSTHTAVIAVDRCNTLRDDDSPEDTITVPIEEYDPLPWQKALEFAGIYAISNNTCCREKAKVSLYLDAPAATDNIAFSTPPEHELLAQAEEAQELRAERILKVRNAMSRLTARQREILLLVHENRLTQDAAAEKAGLSRKSVRTHLERAEKKFKKFYESCSHFDPQNHNE